MNKNGVDLATQISADSISFSNDISTGGTIGTVITYKLKAVNNAGSSPYTEDLVVKVGSVPNAPTNVRITSQMQQSEVEISWNADVYITGNPTTNGYRVYLND